MGIQNKYKPFIKKRVWMAAACIVVLLVSGYSIFLMRDNTVSQANQKTKVSKSAGTVTWVTVDNKEKERKIILLKDNSEIVLFPSSSIRYASDFNTKERNVYLIGRANFTVAKNKAKPFTVFSDEIATTAIGTRFQVYENSPLGTISVKLYEGIVRIQSTKRSIQGWENGKLLYPGEEVWFKNGKATAKLNAVLEKSKVITEITAVNKSLADEVVFSNTPLSEVFETMGKMYGINIIYNKNDVAGMHLTTTISIKDKPSSILDAIVQMNALTYQKNEKGFMIVGLAH